MTSFIKLNNIDKHLKCSSIEKENISVTKRKIVYIMRHVLLI